MAETAWEKQRKIRKKYLLWLLAFIVLIPVAGLIAYNNREYFSSQVPAGGIFKTPADTVVKDAGAHPEQSPPESSQPTGQGTFTVTSGEKPDGMNRTAPVGTQVKRTEPAIKKTTPVPVTVKKEERTVITPVPQKKESVKNAVAADQPSAGTQRESAGTEQDFTKASEKAQNVPVEKYSAAGMHCDSVLLSGIDCSMIGRKDIRVRLSLQLYIDDCSFTKEVLMKREAVKVMVKKTMQSREFGSIQTERLRNELRTAVNGVLGKTEVADLEFRDFRIEEVRK